MNKLQQIIITNIYLNLLTYSTIQQHHLSFGYSSSAEEKMLVEIGGEEKLLVEIGGEEKPLVEICDAQMNLHLTNPFPRRLRVLELISTNTILASLTS
jgi:hypothetical protein